jgi:hypothetical protein
MDLHSATLEIDKGSGIARQPIVVLNAALLKTVDTGSGIGWFRRIGGLAMAPNLM